MLTLEALIRDAIAAKTPTIGICLDTRSWQLLWAARFKRHRLVNGELLFIAIRSIKMVMIVRDGWMKGLKSFSLQASHQDQVTVLPESGCLLAGNDFCPNGMIAYGNAGLSMQLHPELSSENVKTMLLKRRGHEMSVDDADEALAHVEDPLTRQGLLNGWCGFQTTARLGPACQ